MKKKTPIVLDYILTTTKKSSAVRVYSTHSVESQLTQPESSATCGYNLLVRLAGTWFFVNSPELILDNFMIFFRGDSNRCLTSTPKSDLKSYVMEETTETRSSEHSPGR